MRKIAVSDIHGCLLSFESLLDKVAFSTSDELFLLGDYIDRGPDSRKTLDLILQLRHNGYQVHCLAGNHDHALIDARTDPSFFLQWYDGWGGKQTMESFGVDDLKDIPAKYWNFINDLELCMEVDNYILVHGGLDFQKADPLKPDINMIYLRNWYDRIRYDWLGDRVIVHGHTPVARHTIESMLQNIETRKVIDIDAGCFAKHLPDKGFLCAFNLSERKLDFVRNIDDVSSYWS